MIRAWKLPGQDSVCHKSDSDKGERINQETLSHTLPTSLHGELAEVVESWQSLPPEIRVEVLELIRSGLPVDPTEGTKDSDG